MTQTSINYGKVLYELSIPKEAVEVSRRISGRSRGVVCCSGKSGSYPGRKRKGN